MKIETTPNKEKAKALLLMAQTTLERLHESNLKKYPSKTLIDYYDIIHKLLDAISYLKGKKFSGEGAHKELIDYVCKKQLTEKARIFLQDMRDFRNRIHYEGFMVNQNYINTNSKYMEEIINLLMPKINEEL